MCADKDMSKLNSEVFIFTSIYALFQQIFMLHAAKCDSKYTVTIIAIYGLL